MFTGIVTDIGQVRATRQMDDLRVEMSTAYDVAALEIGASVACAGVCLTVVEKGVDAGTGHWFAVDVSSETRSVTTIGGWAVGTAVNLERPLRVGDEFGGHIVQGHVDGIGEIIALEPDGGSTRFAFQVPEALARYIAPKGSIAVDGVSLTVNSAGASDFTVNIIPHTKLKTTLGLASVGDRVHLEIDVLARYVARLKDLDVT